MARPTPIELPPASGQLDNGSGCLLMHSTRETTGVGSAVYRFWDGSSTGGMLILPVSLTPGQSTRDTFTHHILPYRQGLFFQLVSGTIEGLVIVLNAHDCIEYWYKIEQELKNVLVGG